MNNKLIFFFLVFFAGINLYSLDQKFIAEQKYSNEKLENVIIYKKITFYYYVNTCCFNCGLYDGFFIFKVPSIISFKDLKDKIKEELKKVESRYEYTFKVDDNLKIRLWRTYNKYESFNDDNILNIAQYDDIVVFLL